VIETGDVTHEYVRISQQVFAYTHWYQGSGSLHKDVEPIISRLGWPVVGKELQGFVDNRSLFELPKSIIVSDLRNINLDINIDARLKDVSNFPEHQIFGKALQLPFA